MGAHTNSLISGIKDAIVALKAARAKKISAYQNLQAAIQARDHAAAEMDNYYRAKGWDTKRSTHEQEMNSDQKWAGLNAKWDSAMNETRRLKKLLETTMSVQTTVNQVAAARLKSLEDYIKKKEVEKSWWQKTSVSAAKQFIVYAREVIV